VDVATARHATLLPSTSANAVYERERAVQRVARGKHVHAEGTTAPHELQVARLFFSVSALLAGAVCCSRYAPQCVR